METLWEFETERLIVKLEIEPSVDPDISWMHQDQLDDLESGHLVFFDAACTVYGPINKILGYDSLGESCYFIPQKFVTDHRDSDPMNRNCSIMRTKRGEKVVICHYFPSMVKQACQQARQTMRNQIKNYSNILR